MSEIQRLCPNYIFVNFCVTLGHKVVRARFLIQKLYFYYGSSIHKTCEKVCILESEISAMLMIDDHALIASGLYGCQLQLIDPDTAHTMRQMNGHPDEISCIVYCSELSRVITGSRDKTVRVWNVAAGECVHVLRGHTNWVTCAAVHGTTYVNCTYWAQ